MRKAIITLALALPAAVSLAACGPTDDAGNTNAGTATNRAAATTTPPPATTTKPPVAATDAHATPAADSPRRITVEEARAAFQRGEAVFVDVRGEDAFRQGHIPGALSIPTGTAAQHADKLPKNKLIITYCA